MKDKLELKLQKELDEFKEEVKEQGADYAIDRAYEIVAKQEIIDSIIYDHELSKKEIKALLSRGHVLEEMYDDWLSFDGNMREDINYSVDDTLEFIMRDYSINKSEVEECER